jgi:hypothetical protein
MWERTEEARVRQWVYKQHAGVGRACGHATLVEAPLGLNPGALWGYRIAEELIFQVRRVEVQNVEDEVTADQEDGAQHYSPPADGSALPTTEEVHGPSGRQRRHKRTDIPPRIMWSPYRFLSIAKLLFSNKIITGLSPTHSA